MIRHIYLALGLLAPALNQALAEDGLTCARERPAFRQFCSVRTDEFVQTNTLTFKAVYNSVRLPSKTVLITAIFPIKNSDGTTDNVLLPGLVPELRVVTDLSNLANCKIAGIWKNRLVLQIKSVSSDDNLQANISYGPQDHIVSLARYNEDSLGQTLFSFTDLSDSSIQVKATFSLKNLDSAEPSIERIPTECALKLGGFVVGYNSTRVRTDLKWIKTVVKSKDRELIKSYIINAFHLDQQKGAVCAVKSFANKLKMIEVLPDAEPYTSLSSMSQSSVSESIQNAIDMGAIPKFLVDANDPDGKWKFFISERGQAFFNDICSVQPSYDVDKDAFVENGKVTNNQAYQNALDYERERDNLLQALGVTWALVGAAAADVTTSNDLQWVIDPSLYGPFKP